MNSKEETSYANHQIEKIVDESIGKENEMPLKFSFE